MKTANELIDDFDETLLDSSSICAPPAGEHDEIATNECLCAWARHLAYQEMVQIHDQFPEGRKSAVLS
jgi:ferritin-like metal-binding protein YciE